MCGVSDTLIRSPAVAMAQPLPFPCCQDLLSTNPPPSPHEEAAGAKTMVRGSEYPLVFPPLHGVCRAVSEDGAVYIVWTRLPAQYLRSPNKHTYQS